ncbi:MAG TPA: Nif3-like dinuclear metal center hexameric protein [Pseudoclavibacter sp.]|nr:Nif3-like dinuclear metal center hexameric protein [Pseudoclavibacter sp.]
MPKLAEVWDVVDALWPRTLAEPWDHPGLVAGELDAEVDVVWLTVDVTEDVTEDALDGGAQLILAHHPLLFHPVDSVAATTSRGRILHRLISQGCALVCAHTNADAVRTGTSAQLAHLLGLTRAVPLAPRDEDGAQGIGVVGDAPSGMTLGALAQAVARAVPATARGIAASGPYHAPVHRVAICAGAGDSLLDVVSGSDADVYITSDLRHHPGLDFRMEADPSGPFLIDVSHWASEWVWLEQAKRELLRVLPDLRVHICDVRTDIWDFVVTQ